MEEPFSKVPMGIYFKYENAVYRKCTKDCAEDIRTHRLRWFNPRVTIRYAKQVRKIGGRT